MFERLADASRFILLPAVVLYLFGFICVTSYLSQFGIVTFDIVNARYLIAGIFPLFSLLVSLYIAWVSYQGILPLKDFWTSAIWPRKVGFCFQYFLSIWFGTYLAKLLLTVFRTYCNCKATLPQTSHSPYDAIQGPIKHLLESLPNAIARDIVDTGFVFIIAAALAALVAVGYYAFRLLKWLRRVRRPPAPAIAPVSETTVPAAKQPKAASTANYVTANVVTICLLLGVLWASSETLHASAYGFASFSTPSTLSYSILFAWMYATASAIFFFLVWAEPSQLQFSMTKILGISPIGLQQAFQVLLVPVVGSLFVFGTSIFPRIPYAMGGGEPREVIVHGDALPVSLQNRVVFLVGESSQFLFIVDPDTKDPKAYQINKDIVQYVQTAGDMAY